jgi:hypothetical protein
MNDKGKDLERGAQDILEGTYYPSICLDRLNLSQDSQQLGFIYESYTFNKQSTESLLYQPTW